ncbi:MAG: diaminopimelate decarboxylase [Parasphingorhabdus sp.]
MMVSPLVSPCENFWWERDDLNYLDDRLHFAGRDVGKLAAEADGPLYLYSLYRVAAKLDGLLQALAASGCDHRVYYAMKANRFEPLLQMMARSGKCGVDICSPNELDLALSCGFTADQISFTGTGVANRDLDRLIAHPDLMINCDSIGMIRRIGERQPGRAIGIRVNPGLGTGYGDSAMLTYAGAKTTKFGIYREQWAEALAMARKFGLKIETLHFHVGCGYLNSELDSWNMAVTAALSCLADLPGLKMVNVGGGLGLPHREGDRPLDLTRWSEILRSHFADSGLTIAVEPGDFLVKDAGMLVLGVTDVERKRDQLFVSVDGGFNLHPEPAFYDLPCEPVACLIRSRDPADWQSATIAGNINEALDVWGEAVAIPPLFEEDFIALINAGGYGAAMSSNHCMRGDFTEMAV